MSKIKTQRQRRNKKNKAFCLFLALAGIVLSQSVQAGEVDNYYIFQEDMSKTKGLSDSFLPHFSARGFAHKTRNTQHDGFKGYAQGAEAVLSTKVSDSFSVGAGYVSSTVRLKTKEAVNRIKGDSFFVFGKYQPHKWYVSAKSLMNHSRYHDKLFEKARARADIYRGELFSGYEMGNVHNYSGIKYTYTHPVHQKDNMILSAPRHNGTLVTAVIGTQYGRQFQTGADTTVKPMLWVSGNYDLKSSNAQSFIDIPETSAFYVLNNRRLHRASLDFGVGLSASYKQLECAVGYGADWRVGQFAQTGKASLSFKF